MAHFVDVVVRRMTGKRDLVRVFNPEVNPFKEHRRMAFDPFFEGMFRAMVDSNLDRYKK